MTDTPPWEQKSASNTPPWEKSSQSPDFLSRVKGDVQNRFEKMGETSGYAQAGRNTAPETGLQLAGQLKGLYGDLWGETAASGYSALPDFVKQPINQKMTQLAQSPIGKQALALVQKGGDAWKKFSQKYPTEALDAESAFNLVVGGTGGKAAKETENVGTKVGENLIQSGEKLADENKTKFVRNLVSEPSTKKVELERVGRTTEKGLLKNKVVEPNYFEKRAAEEVSKIPGVSSKNSYQANWNAINQERIKEAEKLGAALKAKDVPISPQEFQNAAQDLSKKIKKSIIITDSNKQTVSTVVNQMGRLVAEKGMTANGVFEARKAFDQWVEGVKGSMAFETSEKNAFNKAVSEVRRSANELVASKVPDAGVKASLAKQTALYDALDNIAPKAVKEGPNSLSRFFRGLSDAIPGKTGLEKEAATAMGAYGVKQHPITSALAAGAGGAYQAGKALTGAEARKIAGKVLTSPKTAMIANLSNPVGSTALGLSNKALQAVPESPQQPVSTVLSPNQFPMNNQELSDLLSGLK